MPVVVVTSIGNPATEKRLLETGAYAIIQKPLSPAKLTQVLNKINVRNFVSFARSTINSRFLKVSF